MAPPPKTVHAFFPFAAEFPVFVLARPSLELRDKLPQLLLGEGVLDFVELVSVRLSVPGLFAFLGVGVIDTGACGRVNVVSIKDDVDCVGLEDKAGGQVDLLCEPGCGRVWIIRLHEGHLERAVTVRVQGHLLAG